MRNGLMGSPFVIVDSRLGLGLAPGALEVAYTAIRYLNQTCGPDPQFAQVGTQRIDCRDFAQREELRTAGG
jgi:hypothetical protein